MAIFEVQQINNFHNNFSAKCMFAEKKWHGVIGAKEMFHSILLQITQKDTNIWLCNAISLFLCNSK